MPTSRAIGKSLQQVYFRIALSLPGPQGLYASSWRSNVCRCPQTVHECWVRFISQIKHFMFHVNHGEFHSDTLCDMFFEQKVSPWERNRLDAFYAWHVFSFLWSDYDEVAYIPDILSNLVLLTLRQGNVQLQVHHRSLCHRNTDVIVLASLCTTHTKSVERCTFWEVASMTWYKHQ